MVSRRGLLGVALVLTLGPGGVWAQTGPFEEAEVWIGVTNWTGNQGDLFRPGPRVMLAAAAELPDERKVLLELLYGGYASDEGGTSVRELGVRVAARQVLGDPWGSNLWVQGRVGVHRISGTGARAGYQQIGFLAGPEVGVEKPVHPRIRLLAAFEVAWQWYGDTSGGGERFEDTGGYAFHYGLRVGGAYRWGR